MASEIAQVPKGLTPEKQGKRKVLVVYNFDESYYDSRPLKETTHTNVFGKIFSAALSTRRKTLRLHGRISYLGNQAVYLF